MEEKTTKTEKIEAPIKLKGKFIQAIGRRKTATARIHLYKKGEGIILVNTEKAQSYFTKEKFTILKQPLKLTGLVREVNLSVVVRGGGKKSQAEAARHGISRALIELDEDLKLQLKPKGWLTRDARAKERKKPGLKKARRAPQWSKR